jgi:LCP family protein required for cell wall assembly
VNVPRLHRRTGVAAAIIGVTVVAVYLALVVFLRIDSYLFPGNEPSLPGVPVFVPGTEIGVDVSLPGVSSPNEQPWTAAAQLNILVLGLDRRPGVSEDQPSRSDTMFVASIDKLQDRVQLLAIPRDLWADIPYGNAPGTWAQGKINAAFDYGIYYGYPGGGPAAAVAAVEHNYNIDIQHYVVIDWTGFIQLINAIGGIDIDVPAEISDFATDVLDAFPNQTVKAGPQHMDGKQALGYSRVRTDGDLKRIERQQYVIKAVANRAVSFGYIAKLPELWNAYHQAIRTDIDTGLVPGFALLARQLNLENIETFSLGPASYPGISDDGQLILLPNRDELYGIIDRFLADPKLRDENPVLAVEYPAGMETEAANAKEHLIAYGVPAESVRLIKGEGGGPGIFDLTGKSYTAAKLAGLFDLRLLNNPGTTPDGVDVLVRLGSGVAFKNP